MILFPFMPLIPASYGSNPSFRKYFVFLDLRIKKARTYLPCRKQFVFIIDMFQIYSLLSLQFRYMLASTHRSLYVLSVFVTSSCSLSETLFSRKRASTSLSISSNFLFICKLSLNIIPSTINGDELHHSPMLNVIDI